MLALGWNKKKIKKEGKISEATYFRIVNEFQRLSEEERQRVLSEAEQDLTERIFDKKAWFDTKTCKSRIDVIQRWYDIMTLRGVSAVVKRAKIRNFRNICLGYAGNGCQNQKTRVIEWKIHPKDFTEDHGIRYVSALKSLGIGDHMARLTIRNFLLYGKGMVPTVISGKKQGYGKMAKEYFTDLEVERIFEYIEALPERERMPLKACLMFMLHSGTRVMATLRLTEKDLIREGSEVWQVHVVDKGKEGKKEKIKVLVSVLRKVLSEYLEWRKRHGINDERLFYFGYSICKDSKILNKKLKKIYARTLPNRKIFQPCHIWRHTFAMHYLRKTGWNYDLVAELGGWDDTKTLKDCYGKPDFKDIVQFLEKIEGGEKVGKKVVIWRENRI